MSQLQTDVCVQPVGSNGIENLLIKLRAVARLVGVRDVLAEVVDADAHPSLVYGLGYAYGIGDFGSGYKSSGNPLSNRRTLGEATQRSILRKMDEEGPQHEVPATSK